NGRTVGHPFDLEFVPADRPVGNATRIKIKPSRVGTSRKAALIIGIIDHLTGQRAGARPEVYVVTANSEQLLQRAIWITGPAIGADLAVTAGLTIGPGAAHRVIKIKGEPGMAFHLGA